jgi:hypothetical protein
MPYTINLTNGNVLVNINDGTIDNTTGLKLAGRNYAGYGELLNENLVHLLENFASDLEPGYSLQGQIWYDTTAQSLKVKRGAAYIPIPVSTPLYVEPDTHRIGDYWWDLDNNQLKVSDGINWITIGPDYSKKQGLSGAKTLVIVDNIANSHTCIGMYANGGLYAIISEDSSFTPRTPIAGFPLIKPGYNITSSETPSHKYWGTATNAENLDGTPAATYLRNDRDATISANLSVNTWGNLTIAGNFTQGLLSSIKEVGIQTIITNTDRGGNIAFYGNLGANIVGIPITSPIVTIRNDIGEMVVRANPTQNLGVVTKQYADSATANLYSALSANVTTINANIGLNINAMVANVTAANVEIGRLRANITAANAAIITANTAVVNYVNDINTVTQNTFTAANAAMATANVNMKSYVDGQVTTLNSNIALRATISSPGLTGTPTAPTASALTWATSSANPSGGTNSTQIATTAYVKDSIANQKFNYTVSDQNPSGGNDGDFWFKYQ